MLSRFFISLVILTLTACTNPTHAPIVNGWKQTSNHEASSYLVQPEDSIYSIAWSFGMDYRDLAQYNRLKEPYHLQVGQSLRMSPPTHAAVNTPSSLKQNDSIAPQTSPIIRSPDRVPHIPQATRNPSSETISAAAATENSRITGWVWPVKGRIIKHFSDDNRGIDIAGKSGDPVSAAAGGKIVYAGSGLKGYGNLVIIKHNDNELSAYAFNKSLLVKEGDYVTSGQKIAYMGKNNEGNSALHFEIRRNGNPVNPMPYLGRGNSQ